MEWIGMRLGLNGGFRPIGIPGAFPAAVAAGRAEKEARRCIPASLKARHPP